MDINAKLINTVAAVIIKEKKVLIVQTKDSKWEFPKGKLIPDEKVDDGIVREMKEKLSISVVPTAEIGSIEIDQTNIVEIVMFICVKPDSDLSDIHLSVHREYRFIDWKELKELDLSTADRLFTTQCETELKKYLE